MDTTEFGRYRVIDRIADGGFATVYLAEDPSLTGRVAIKVLRENLAADADIRSRFISEARVMRQLATPSLVTVHDINEQDGQPYFVMEYCERGTLADRLTEPARTASVDDAMQLARFLAGAIVPVHNAGIAHRDLKPANLLIRRTEISTRTIVGDLLGPDEELVLGDFGLAKVIEPFATQFTMAMGTPGYSAPEQFEGIGSVDGTADVYAASATIVAAMSGTKPQTVATPDSTAFTDTAMAATGPLRNELARGLSFERSDRHPTIVDWYQALLAASEKPETGPSLGGPIDLGIEHLSDYRMIGRGGFSVVYAAHHELFQRPVAVKVLSRQLEESDRRRFERECQLMGQMSTHPNVVTVHTAGYTEDDSPYILMELVEGGTLSKLLSARGRIPWPEAVKHITPIAQALGHGHDQNILHRDVKPENILLDKGVPKLADFGIASFRDAAGATSTHVTASWLHTAPETFDNNRDERSDIYSLASTLYQLVAGRAPFWKPDDESLSPLMKRLLTDPAPQLGPELAPPGVNEFFATALAKEPAHRPQTTAALIAAMQNLEPRPQQPAPAPAATPFEPATDRSTILVDPPTSSPSKIGKPPVLLPEPRRKSRDNRPARRLVGALVGLIAFAVLGTVGLLAFGDPDEELTEAEEDLIGPGTSIPETTSTIRDETEDASETGDETEDESDDRTDTSLLVPNVEGLTQDQATARLAELGFEVSVTSETHATIASGLVIATSPRAAETLRRGSTVELRVSSGPTTDTGTEIEYTDVPIDFDLACQEQWGAGSSAYEANSAEPVEFWCEKILGPPNPTAYCQAVLLPDAIAISDIIAISNSAGDLDAYQCQYVVEELIGISVGTACEEQLHPNATAIIGDASRATSWYCELDGENIGGVSVKDYCEDRGWEHRLVAPEDAYSWRCFNGKTDIGQFSVDFDQVCSEVYPDSNGIPRLQVNGETLNDLACFDYLGTLAFDTYCEARDGTFIRATEGTKGLQCRVQA